MKNILVVDDDAYIIDLVAAFFMDYPMIAVHGAATEDEAMRMFIELNPDCVLMDGSIVKSREGVSEGPARCIGLVMKMHAIDAGKAVIAHSGTSSSNTALMDAGCAATVAKGTDHHMMDLTETVEKILGISHPEAVHA